MEPACKRLNKLGLEVVDKKRCCLERQPKKRRELTAPVQLPFPNSLMVPVHCCLCRNEWISLHPASAGICVSTNQSTRPASAEQHFGRERGRRERISRTTRKRRGQCKFQGGVTVSQGPANIQEPPRDTSITGTVM